MVKKYLWNNASISKATKCTLHGKCCGNKLTFDSRKVEQGDIFVALQGEKVDGHNFINDALSRGASCAIVQYIPEYVKYSNCLIEVENVLAAVKDMAFFNRARSKAKIVGITGSVGKTSTKEAVRKALGSDGDVFCTSGNLNGQIAIPIAVASMPLDVRYGVYEMGMSFSGEMTKITKIVKPDIVIVSNIFGVHLENFASVEDIARAKAEIFLGMPKDGTVLLNRDNKYTKMLSECAKAQGINKIYTFGKDRDSDACLEEYCVKNGSALIRASIFGEIISFNTNVCGEHHAINMLSSLLLSKILDVRLGKAILSLREFQQLKGRGVIEPLVIDNKNIVLVDESYNSSPAAVKSALEAFQEICEGDDSIKRRVVILGDMYELGDDAEQLHRDLLDLIQFSAIDKVLTVGKLMKELYSVLPDNMKLGHFNSYQDIIKEVCVFLCSGDALLIKGSNGTKMYEVVKYLENHSAV